MPKTNDSIAVTIALHQSLVNDPANAVVAKELDGRLNAFKARLSAKKAEVKDFSDDLRSLHSAGILSVTEVANLLRRSVPHASFISIDLFVSYNQAELLAKLTLIHALYVDQRNQPGKLEDAENGLLLFLKSASSSSRFSYDFLTDRAYSSLLDDLKSQGEGRGSIYQRVCAILIAQKSDISSRVPGDLGAIANALNKESQLGEIVWAKRGFVEPTLFDGNRCDLVEQYRGCYWRFQQRERDLLDQNQAEQRAFSINPSQNVPALVESARYGRLDEVQKSSELSREIQIRALFVAAENDHIEVVKYFLRDKALPGDSVDALGNTLLMHVVAQQAIGMRVAHYLIEHVTHDLNYQNKHYFTLSDYLNIFPGKRDKAELVRALKAQEKSASSVPAVATAVAVGEFPEAVDAVPYSRDQKEKTEGNLEAEGVNASSGDAEVVSKQPAGKKASWLSAQSKKTADQQKPVAGAGGGFSNPSASASRASMLDRLMPKAPTGSISSLFSRRKENQAAADEATTLASTLPVVDARKVGDQDQDQDPVVATPIPD